MYWDQHTDFITSNVICEYFQNLVEHLNDRSVIILDNTPCHSRYTSFPEGVDCPSVKKLSPYSPMLNAIEEAFSCLKYAVKAKYGEMQEELYSTSIPRKQGLSVLSSVVDNVISSQLITQQKIIQWDNHILQFVGKCLNMVDV